MEIFGVGLPEILLIAVVALIVLGPERLPEAARAAGKAIRDLRQAVEPARSAWTELSSEITGVTETLAAPQRATIKPARPGEKTTAIPAENPWKIHPITEGMTEEERDHFMGTGVIPEHILADLELRKSAGVAAHNGSSALDIGTLAYPAPHEVTPGAVASQAEYLDYPTPSTGKAPGNQDTSGK
jgi:Tat protein translocase TatB subunit